jgi:hypothetical protein
MDILYSKMLENKRPADPDIAKIWYINNSASKYNKVVHI